MKSKLSILLALSLAVVGCNKKEEKNASNNEKTAKKEVAAEKKVEVKKATAPEGFTKNPTAESVVEGPIKGIGNGVPFEAKAIIFQPSNDKWSVKIADKELKKPLGFFPSGTQFFEADLPETPAAGKSITRELKYGDGMFHMNKPDGSGMVSMNAANSYYLEFTKWEVKDYDPNGDRWQVAGKASGKVYIAYEASNNFKGAVVSGTFEDATVRFMGPPRLK